MAILAALMGMLVVLGADKLQRTGLITGDASQGLIFPVLFALGVLLLSTTLANVHICQDTVLTGDLNLMALTPEHIIIGGYDIGPRTMWHLIVVMALNASFIGVVYRVLKTSTFDRQFAVTIGFPVRVVELGLMLLVSLTVVVAFNAAGAVLVIALMIVPASAALLLTTSLRSTICATIAIAALSALAGFLIAWQLDLATSAAMAFVDGVIFLLVLGAVKLFPRVRRHPAKVRAPQSA